MNKSDDRNEILNAVEKYSSPFDKSAGETAVILAAGHGKRIKSQKSKMLHEIWGVPTVVRVFDACRNGLNGCNIITVVGIKALNVIESVGERGSSLFAYQEEQHGTGHAAQVALEKIPDDDYNGTVFVYPGDMGLINEQTVKLFKDEFYQSGSDMMVLTGLYEGDYKENYYGRIVRAKEKDADGKDSNANGEVIKIMEHKDILNLSEEEPHTVEFKGKTYSYTKEELLKNNEFNSGVFAFKYNYLSKLIGKIESNNVQKEIYLTDMIHLFNKEGLSVGAVSPKQQHVIMGFNNKSVLKEMEKIARGFIYDKIKDIIEIEDEEDFYIDEEIINEIVEMDKKGIPLDISLSKGAYIGKGVKINYMNRFYRGTYLKGNIKLGKNAGIGEGAEITTYAGQEMAIGENTEILRGDIVKGNLKIGKNCKIESGVNMTGSDEYPVEIGDNVTIKGNSYIFGSKIENDILIYHSVLIRKQIVNPNKNGEVYKIGFYIPEPEGTGAIKEL